jgi:hypothetical protein
LQVISFPAKNADPHIRISHIAAHFPFFARVSRTSIRACVLQRVQAAGNQQLKAAGEKLNAAFRIG